MWTTLSFSRWTCLLTLAVVMLLSTSEVDSTLVGLSCCHKSRNVKKPESIEKCFEQKERHGCQHHAFVIKTEGKVVCVKPTSKWLTELIETEELKCPPDISYKHRFELLDEDE